MVLRGAFGEGTKAVGEMYQLSNQITLGLSERQAIENLASIAGQLIEQERRLRKEMLSTVQSLVRLGLSEGRLSGVELGTVNGLAVEVQPATLMAAGGRQLSTEDRDRLRADILRDTFKDIKIL